MSFRDKLNVARSSLSNGDNTVNTHYICNFCFRRISLSKSTYHNNICGRRKIYCSSSSESELYFEDSSSSEEVIFEYEEEEVHKDEEEVHEEEEEVHEEEEEVHEEEKEVQEENRNQLPIDIDEDDEKQPEDGPVEQENKQEEILAKEAEEVEDEIPEKDVQQEAKTKKLREILQQFTIYKKIRIVESWKNEKKMKKREWCQKNNLNKRVLNRWIRNYPNWKKLPLSEKRRTRKKYIQKGKYHDQEVELYKLFTQRRAHKHRVTGRWIRATMKHLIRESLPDVDTNNKFKEPWLRAFCKRFRISWQKRTNKKNKGVMERLNKCKRYHWWVIYKMGLELPHNMEIKNQKKKEKKKKETKPNSKNQKKPKKKQNLKKEEQGPIIISPPPLLKIISKKSKKKR